MRNLINIINKPVKESLLQLSLVDCKNISSELSEMFFEQLEKSSFLSKLNLSGTKCLFNSKNAF